jgi:predicted deacylase
VGKPETDNLMGWLTDIGVEVVRRIVHDNYCKGLLKGTVICIPILNIYGFLQDERYVPGESSTWTRITYLLLISLYVIDGKDVNRCFPGSRTGSLAHLVAYTITNQILPVVDFGFDFHTGGASRTIPSVSN